MKRAVLPVIALLIGSFLIVDSAQAFGFFFGLGLRRRFVRDRVVVVDRDRGRNNNDLQTLLLLQQLNAQNSQRRSDVDDLRQLLLQQQLLNQQRNVGVQSQQPVFIRDNNCNNGINTRFIRDSNGRIIQIR